MNMTDPQIIVRHGLEGIGLGPLRMESALGGAELFGPTGLLNSLELVQLIAALSESTRIDAFEFLEGFESCIENVFRDVGSLCGFLSGRLSSALKA